MKVTPVGNFSKTSYEFVNGFVLIILHIMWKPNLINYKYLICISQIQACHPPGQPRGICLGSTSQKRGIYSQFQFAFEIFECLSVTSECSLPRFISKFVPMFYDDSIAFKLCDWLTRQLQMTKLHDHRKSLKRTSKRTFYNVYIPNLHINVGSQISKEQ
jgi:hypothetical protein